LSTVSKSPASKSPHARREQDPYRYGWRYVPITRPDGTEDFDQVPLTEEDVLHPEVGDFIVQTKAHDEDRIYLKQVFETQLEDEPAAAVISDHLVDWNIPGVRPLAPDIAVFWSVKRHDDWETFDVKAEGARPALVVEVTSRSTRKNDLGVKVDYYHRAKVPLYLIADAVGRGARRRVKLIGRRYTRSEYKLITPGEHGRIYLEPVRLWVGITRDPGKGYEWLACYDPDTGEELGDYA
jgi:colicin import membrane protein